MAAGVGEGLDLVFGAAEDEGLGMAGVGVAQDAGLGIGDEIKGGGKHGRSGAFEDVAQVGVELAHEIPGFAREGLQLLGHRTDHGGDEGGADAMTGDVADEDAGFGV